MYNNIIKEKEPHRNSIDLESKAPPKDTDEHRPNTPPPKNSIDCVLLFFLLTQIPHTQFPTRSMGFYRVNKYNGIYADLRQRR